MPEPPPLGTFPFPKWRVFESWCLAHAVDPVNSPVGPVLELLQEKLTAGAAATTLRVYVAAIAARRELDEIPLGRHRMVSAFMRGVRRLRPVRPIGVPSWDLSIVLEGLIAAPFEPLVSAPEQILTLKFMFLLALASLKRVGDLQVLSVSEMCMDFAPGLVKVTLRPRPGYVPQDFIRIVSLSSGHTSLFSSSLCFRWEWEASHALSCPSFEDICGPLQTLEKISPFACVLWCCRRGLATSKHRISHWVRDTISLAYEVRGLPSPLSVRAHSTRSVASSRALFWGVLLEDIGAQGWFSPHIFIRFYNLDLDMAPGSQIRSVWTGRVCCLVHKLAR